MISTRFLPISCTSPFTVARITLPRAAVSAFSMNCSRWLTAAFMASADCSTSATISSLLLNRRPTSLMPLISGPLMISSGAAPSARLRSRSATRPSLVPSLNQHIGRHLDSQVDHLVAVVGQDDLHQVLADLVCRLLLEKQTAPRDPIILA